MNDLRLDMFEVINYLYKDKFKDYEPESDEHWDAVMDWVEDQCLDKGGEFVERLIYDLLSLTPLIKSPMSDTLYHAFIADEDTHTYALAKRPSC